MPELSGAADFELLGTVSAVSGRCPVMAGSLANPIIAGPRRCCLEGAERWMSQAYYDRVAEAAAFVRSRLPAVPAVALVLGSGLGGLADRLEERCRIAYGEIPHWPPSRVAGHQGCLIAGRTAGADVLGLAGRAHFYEGHDLRTVTFSIRVLGLLGVTVLILTNAAGGINRAFAEGALMVIDDHINLMGANPLAGPNDDRFGPRFLDLSEVYSRRLRALADAAALGFGLRLEHGVYVGLPGPSYETPAEIRFLRLAGGDAVGMSTVPEAIVARHMGMEVLGVSCITNMAAGVLPQPLGHEHVIETAHRMQGECGVLLEGILGKL